MLGFIRYLFAVLVGAAVAAFPLLLSFLLKDFDDDIFLILVIVCISFPLGLCMSKIIIDGE